MPKNINSITMIITLEGIEKIKSEMNDNNENSLNNHAGVYKLSGFYFPSMKIHNTSSEAG